MKRPRLPAKPRLDPDHLRAWQALLAAHRTAVHRMDQDVQAGGGLPLHWYDVLLELFRAPEKALRMGELGRRVVLTRSGISRLVTRLVRERLVTKRTVDGDARGVNVQLTPQGEAAFRRTWPLYAAGIQAHFARLLTPAAARRIAPVLEAVGRRS